MTGIYLVKDQVIELKFLNQGRKVLKKVSAIYEREFAVNYGY
ncbi:hypothetical protein [Paenibacillus sp. SYP-B3998]|nr:hypothetical protein [Paenibacillus sp. SYP-B3998]